jgi:hypothetical protein
MVARDLGLAFVISDERFPHRLAASSFVHSGAHRATVARRMLATALMLMAEPRDQLDERRPRCQRGVPRFPGSLALPSAPFRRAASA